MLVGPNNTIYGGYLSEQAKWRNVVLANLTCGKIVDAALVADDQFIVTLGVGPLCSTINLFKVNLAKESPLPQFMHITQATLKVKNHFSRLEKVAENMVLVRGKNSSRAIVIGKDSLKMLDSTI